MDIFRIYWIDRNGRVSGIEELRALDDDAAIEKAAALCVVAGYAGFEAWRGEMPVGACAQSNHMCLSQERV
jgi:hypothetical protein